MGYTHSFSRFYGGITSPQYYIFPINGENVVIKSEIIDKDYVTDEIGITIYWNQNDNSTYGTILENNLYFRSTYEKHISPPAYGYLIIRVVDNSSFLYQNYPTYKIQYLSD